MFKTIGIYGEQCNFQADHSTGDGHILMRVADYKLDKETSIEVGHDHFIEDQKIEIYPSIEEVKALIKALQTLLPEGEN